MINYHTLTWRKTATTRQFVVAAVAAQFVTSLTKYLDPAELELAVLKGGTFEQLQDFCDPRDILEEALTAIVDDVPDSWMPRDGKLETLDSILHSAEVVALSMLTEVYGRPVPEVA